MKYLQAYTPFYGIYYLLKNDLEILMDFHENSTFNFIFTALVHASYIAICFNFIN
jgi:hypothetical protein